MELCGSVSNRFTSHCLLLLLCISFLPANDGKTLTIQQNHRSRRSQSVDFSQDCLSPDDNNVLAKIRNKRDLTIINNSSTLSKPIDTTNVTQLLDSHNQLVVYWAGLDVIICLARDSKSTTPSALHISTDYGSKFTEISDQLLLDETNKTSFPTLDKFFNHPKNNGHFVFTDVRHQYIFTTTNYGSTFSKTRVDFTPNEVSFDPNSDHTLVAYETSTPRRRLYVSLDFGDTWKLTEESIKSIAWDESVVPTSLYLGRGEPDGNMTLLSSTSLFQDPTDTQVLLTEIEDFDIKNAYIFATKKKEGSELQLLVSYKRGKFLDALFPVQFPSQHFHIADVSNGQMFVCVTHNETITNLYIGSEPGDINEPPRFSLSLERIVFFKPNLTWSESWLNDVTEEPFVELHHIEGLRGVYIASQFKSSAIGSRKFGLEQIQSLVTFDQGGIWEPLHTPEVDNDGEPIYCKLMANYTKVNCSLHISQRLNELFPHTRAVPILSQKSSIGLVMATGTVDSSLKGHLGVFLSSDGAAHWKQVLKGNYLYNFGDHGGLIAAVKYYKQGDLTNKLLYSTDEGSSWKEFQFYDKEIRVLGLMTEPGENTTVFFVFGSDTKSSKHSWVLIKVDLKNAFDRPCGLSDYKEWAPTDDQPGFRHCLLGQSDFYERRRRNVSCYNGAPYERRTRTKPCLCKRVDFECDFGYKELETDSKKKCIKDTTEHSVGVKAEWCKPGDLYYQRTKGYRKTPGDNCEDGEAQTYLPATIPCAVGNESEFIIVAKRDSVLRIDLNDFSHVEVLPLEGVRAVVAIDFDLKNNCIYWSDVNKDHIMRLHLDGVSTPELLVSDGLKSVEGLSFDWMAGNLYFVDGAMKAIEVIKTDVAILGRLRKTILDKNSGHLDKPRGLAVHPEKGYLFWTDWSTTTPYIGRSELDGSNPLRIVTNADEAMANKTVKWPNGITVDIGKDLIYWVDAHTDVIYSADLNGKNLKRFLAGVSHPFAVGVYKNFVYWDDWTTRSIYTTRTDVANPNEGIITIQENLSRLMDLKVYGLHSQVGSNQCSGPRNTCKHLCFAKPNNTQVCGCPDGLTMANGECLCPNGKPIENGTCVSNCDFKDAFKCKSGFCILHKWRCDGQPDCGPGDTSDEENCESENTCAENQFRCVADGKCIPSHWKCDLDIDCEADGSDELDCAYLVNTCHSEGHFECTNKRCITNNWRCDGEDDCGDNSDEQNCTTLTPVAGSCGVGEFQCADKRCLSNAWVCDGDTDCTDGSDEKNCTGNKCPEWKYQCASGECIRKSWRCDADYDCADHSDEINCTINGHVVPPPSPPASMFGNCSDMEQMFQCAGNTLCIPVFWVNDGIKDCPEGDDELDRVEDVPISPTVTLRPPGRRCPDNHFQCESTGECIYESNFCDGITDCPDGSDEVGCDSVFEKDCPKGYVKCGLSSICIRLEKLRDGVADCPNGFDSNFGNESIARSNCNPGQFLCDVEICLPLYELCDGNANCLDGSDESNETCDNHKPVYQVAGVSVEQAEDFSTFVEWWLPITAKGPFEFLVSYCEVMAEHCRNTTWIKQRRHTLLANETKTHTNYSWKVYVKNGEDIYPPAVYKNFVTKEGASTLPFNLTVYQPDVDNVCVSWNPPKEPNGVITEYSVFFSPPSPPVSVVSLQEKCCISNKKSNPNFLPGTNYTFWVTATNGFNTTEPSKAVSYVFHDDVAKITSAKVKEQSESSVTLEWTASNKGVSEYLITFENQGGLYQFPTNVTAKDKQIKIDNLPPGTKFKYVIVPVNGKMYGLPFRGMFATKGKPLPKVSGLKAEVSSNNILTATWTAVADSRSKSWEYIVLYGKSMAEVATQRFQIKTKITKAIVNRLEACEIYFISVGVVGVSGGIGPMSQDQSFMTLMEEKAPPKNLRAAGSGRNGSVTLTWDAPCAILQKPVGYNLNFREVNLNHTFATTDVVFSNMTNLLYNIVAPYGGRYEVTVSINVTGARPSQPATFDGIPIPSPKMLHQCTACSPPTVYWEPADLPASVSRKGNVSYVVYVSEDESFTKTRPIETGETSLNFEGLQSEHVYYVAVSVKDSEGLQSPLSEHIPLQFIDDPEDPKGQISLSETNLVGIIVTVLVVICILVAALGVFFVRHRRLQVSFLNFASSHYSTSSGAATFQHSAEEEMDSPVIRGFSDDEPLLVA